MTEKIQQSGHTTIQQAAWAQINDRWGGWVWVAIITSIAWMICWIAFSIRTHIEGDLPYMVGALPFIGIFGYYGYVVQQVRKRFWIEFADAYGFTYMVTGDPTRECASHFGRGHSRKMQHVISGELGSRPMRLFTYQYTEGSGKNKTTHHFTVFEFKYSGHFPHLYLNSRKNLDLPSWGGTRIPLPAEFEKKFTLVAPKEYEIEALQVFTPDILVYLLDSGLQYDIELVEQELLVFIRGEVNQLSKLENDFNTAVKLADRLGPVLDKMRFTEIPEHPSVL